MGGWAIDGLLELASDQIRFELSTFLFNYGMLLNHL